MAKKILRHSHEDYKIGDIIFVEYSKLPKILCLGKEYKIGKTAKAILLYLGNKEAKMRVTNI